MLGVDGPGVVQRGGGERVVGDAVDLARQAAGTLEQGFDGRRLEQRQLASGKSQAVPDIGIDLVAVEPGEVVSDDEALGERFVHGHGEAAPELGEADQDEAQALLGIHGEVGEQAEVFEHVVAQMMGLVDDQHRHLLGFGDEPGDLVADCLAGGGAGPLYGQAELPCDGLVHVEYVAGGERDVVDAVEPGVKARGEMAAHGGLARADLAGEQADAAQVDKVAEPGLGLASGAGLEQLVGLGQGLEGQAGEGEVAQIHQSCSLSLRRLSGEGGGSGAGSSASISFVG